MRRVSARLDDRTRAQMTAWTRVRIYRIFKYMYTSRMPDCIHWATPPFCRLYKDVAVPMHRSVHVGVRYFYSLLVSLSTKRGVFNCVQLIVMVCILSTCYVLNYKCFRSRNGCLMPVVYHRIIELSVKTSSMYFDQFLFASEKRFKLACTLTHLTGIAMPSQTIKRKTSDK